MLDIKIIPKKLKSLNNWVVWRLEERNNKGKIELTKVPLNPKTLGGAMSNNPKTWGSFIEAYSTYIGNEGLSGLGFMLENDIVCIDIDNHDNNLTDEQLKDLLNECMKEVPSYSEISFSGNGYHIFAVGKLPEGRRKSKNIEMYDTQRFIALTGNKIGAINDVIEAQAGLEYIHTKYLGSKTVKTNPKSDIQVIKDTKPVSLDEVLKRAKNDERFNMLFEGRWQELGFPSQSEADMSFATKLAFYTGKDIQSMEEIFKVSGLYRDKFDRKQNGSTYGKLLIESAMAWVSDIYDADMVEQELVSYKLDKIKMQDLEQVNTDVVNETVEAKADVLTHSITQSRYTDTANAELMLTSYGEIIRYNWDNKAWFIWNGKVWEWDVKNKIKLFAEKVADDFLEYSKRTFDDYGIKNALRMLNGAGKNSMLNESQHHVGIVNSECDSQKYLINTDSGVYDLDQNILVGHNKELYMTKITHSGVSKKTPTLWLKFLNEIFNGNKDIIKYIQKAVGYTLTGSIKEQIIFILHGGGNNGKSVFIDTIQTLMGDYATSCSIDVIMERKSKGNVETTLARIKGARMLHTSENDEDDSINEALIKQITGGEKVLGRFLYGNEFEYYPEYKLWLSTNNKPKIKGTDFGIWRRIVIIPFDLQITADKVDKNLKDKLELELSEILNWAIEGYQLYKKEGLNLPNILVAEKDKYKNEMDYISNFIGDRIDVKDGYKIIASTVYKEYEKWCKTTNSKVMSSIAFGKEFNKHFEKRRESSGIVYINCAIKSDNVEYTIKKYGDKKNDKNRN